MLLFFLSTCYRRIYHTWACLGTVCCDASGTCTCLACVVAYKSLSLSTSSTLGVNLFRTCACLAGACAVCIDVCCTCRGVPAYELPKLRYFSSFNWKRVISYLRLVWYLLYWRLFRRFCLQIIRYYSYSAVRRENVLYLSLPHGLELPLLLGSSSLYCFPTLSLRSLICCLSLIWIVQVGKGCSSFPSHRRWLRTGSWERIQS